MPLQYVAIDTNQKIIFVLKSGRRANTHLLLSDCKNLEEGRLLSFFQLFRSNPKELSDNNKNLINLNTRKASKTKKDEKP